MLGAYCPLVRALRGPFHRFLQFSVAQVRRLGQYF